MNEKMIEKMNEFVETTDLNENFKNAVRGMSDAEKVFLVHILNNISFTSRGIQPYSVTLKLFCNLFEINTVTATDMQIMQTVNFAIAKISKYEICDDNGYGKKLFCGYKISWVTGMLIVSPNPSLEKIQEKWRNFVS